MENQIIRGEELGSFEAIGISLGISKNENRDGKKSRFAVFTYQSTYSGRVDLSETLSLRIVLVHRHSKP